MTEFEKKQHPSVFVSAGKSSFLACIPLTSNPYYLKPYKDLWEKGYRSAKRKFELGIPQTTALPKPKGDFPRRPFNRIFNKPKYPSYQERTNK